MAKRVIVIGGGPGGYVAAIRAAQLGAEVHLVEKTKLGGTCLNIGCIPTKVLLHTAEMYQKLKHGEKTGLIVENSRVDWSVLQKHKANIVNRLVQGVGGLLKANKITVHNGEAILQDAQTVKVVGENAVTLQGDIIILAVGSEPARIPINGIDLPGVIDSTGALSLPEIPRSLLIAGGGVIGAEFAQLYSALGTEVTVVEMLPEILPPIDGQLTQIIKKELTKLGVTFMTDTGLMEIQQGDELIARVKTKDSEKLIPAQYILISVGRKPNTQGLGLEQLGIQTNKGAIVVDEHFMTNVSGVYAIGDCNAQMMLAHVASAQGMAAVEYALGEHAFYNNKVIPSCVYTVPEIAGVGLTEEQAKAQELSYKVGVFPLAANGKSMIDDGDCGLVKVIADAQSGEILGAHIIGPRATDMIGELALAMNMQATTEEIVATIHAHPTVSEAIAEAAHAVFANPIHWPPGVRV